MTTVDTIIELNKIGRQLEVAKSELQEAHDGIIEALQTYEKAMQQLIEENRQPND